MKFVTKPHTFIRRNLALVKTCDEILSSLNSDGYNITLRGLFYRLVIQSTIANSEKEYNKLSTLIANARRGGYIDWNHIVDLTRRLESNSHWDSPEDIIESAAESYHIDLRSTQEYRPEIWIEKSALLGVLLPTCQKLDVSLLATRGHPSVTVLWDARCRIEQNYTDHNQSTVIFYLGDHDPTGLSIPEVINEEFAFHRETMGMMFERIALNRNQVDQYNLPPNPAKEKDTNFKKYAAKHGKKCWELDALSPEVLIALVEDAVETFTDPDAFSEREIIQEEGR